MQTTGEALVLAGAIFVLLGAVGAIRFRDRYARMHAAAKVPTMGLLLTVAGALFILDGAPAIALLVMAALLQLITGPVAAHLIGRAAAEQDHPTAPGDPNRHGPASGPTNER